MADDNVNELPVSVDLDLDQAERPKGAEHFRTRVNKKVLSFANPEDLDWRDILLMENPAEIIRLALDDEDRRFLYEQELPAWKMNKLLEAYQAHFGLEDKIRDARRRSHLAGI